MNMKKITAFMLASGLFISAASLVMTSCTKEGPQGEPGTNGTNGINAAATCMQCHNFSDTIVTKIFQYDASQHATGSTANEGTNKQCAPCHSSQGFVECIGTNADTTVAPYNDAAPINCRTCHNIHKTYTSTDWALQTVAAFNPRFDKTKTLNLAFDGGISNLCARCHQARAASPPLTNPLSTTDSVKFTSSRWGPHHGPQSLIMAGIGAFETGTSPFGNSPHKDQASCQTCHQGAAMGKYVGGHTLWMTSDDTGDNVAVCKTCHSGIGTTFDVNGKQTEIGTLFNSLKVKLATAGILDSTTMLIKTNKYFKRKAAAIYWNFQMVYADRSMGVHNYQYTHDMLQSGLDYFTTLGY
jgi:hypothetical protein